MTQSSQSVSATSATIASTLDETIAALATFDADRLESIEGQVRAITPESFTRELLEGEGVPELLRRHTALGEILNATAANLRVAAAVMEAKRNGIANGNQDRSNLVLWPR